jgi:hypothetical protein
MQPNLEYAISDQLPQFVLNDFPNFIKFIKLYYKWLGEQSLGTIESVVDLDRTPEQFIQYFSAQYDVLGFGAKSVVGGESGYIYNSRYLKNMKEFYTSKGAETALIFTLKNIYQTDAIVRYPSENILRA